MRFFFYILFSLPCIATAQGLLGNGNFEEENICAEYKVNCAPEAWIYTVPSLFYYPKDASLAHRGIRCLVLIAGHSEKSLYRTFVRSRLVCGLQKGQTYELQFYVRSVHRLLDSLGIYFTAHDFLFEKTPFQKIVPTLYLANSATGIRREDSSWQKVSFHYKATGTEVFITIGNFSKKGISGPTGIDLEKNFLYYVDDISMEPTDRNERMCPDWRLRKEEIYAQDERHEFLERYMKFYRSAPPPVPKPSPTRTISVDTMIVPEVFFATDNFMINQKTASLLDSFAALLKKHTADSIHVYGHTDNQGSEAYNKELSWRRANSVAAYLEKKLGVKIESRGMGSDKPIATNLTAAGRRRNRRVEIYLFLTP